MSADDTLDDDIRLAHGYLALLAERDAAMKVLDVNMPESGLVDACRQIKQIAISASDNSEVLEAERDALKAQLEQALQALAMLRQVRGLQTQIEELRLSLGTARLERDALLADRAEAIRLRALVDAVGEKVCELAIRLGGLRVRDADSTDHE